ncbi:polymorphic toxin type 44 domain-containing protein [Streptomyces violaceusniger]
MTLLKKIMLGASALALGCGLLAATPAQAAANGQQISFCSQDPSVSGTPGGYAVATGTNQNGEVVTTGKIALRGGGNCENLPNWWYQGSINIEWHDYTGQVVTVTQCAVPKVKRDNWINCDDIPVHDQLVAWLHQEISKNVRSDVFKSIQRKYRMGGFPKQLALAQWALMVRPHGPWDHKEYLADRFRGRAYEFDQSRGAYYFQWGYTGYLLSHDFWSNFHYGYVGRSAGIDAKELRTGQSLPGAGKTDAGDRLSVDIGIAFYEKYGSGETPERIADFLTQYTYPLITTGVAKPTP